MIKKYFFILFIIYILNGCINVAIDVPEDIGTPGEGPNIVDNQIVNNYLGPTGNEWRITLVDNSKQVGVWGMNFYVDCRGRFQKFPTSSTETIRFDIENYGGCSYVIPFSCTPNLTRYEGASSYTFTIYDWDATYNYFTQMGSSPYVDAPVISDAGNVFRGIYGGSSRWVELFRYDYIGTGSNSYDGLFYYIGNNMGVDARLLKGIAYIETGGTFNPDLVSNNDTGLMQINTIDNNNNSYSKGHPDYSILAGAAIYKYNYNFFSVERMPTVCMGAATTGCIDSTNISCCTDPKSVNIDYTLLSTEDRNCFAAASYNGGAGYIHYAIALMKNYNWDIDNDTVIDTLWPFEWNNAFGVRGFLKYACERQVAGFPIELIYWRTSVTPPKWEYFKVSRDVSNTTTNIDYVANLYGKTTYAGTLGINIAGNYGFYP